jgi:hypothetical protein
MEASTHRSRRCAVLAAACLFAGCASAGHAPDDAARLQVEVLGVDGHNDTVQRVLMSHADLGTRLPGGSIDLPRLREGGVRVPFFALHVPMYYKGAEAVRRTLDLRDAMQSVFDRYPEEIELATSAGDIERIAGPVTSSGGRA